MPASSTCSGWPFCGGDLASGSVVRIEQLQERYGVSRSVVREAVRVLASMGLVASRRRVGVQVLPAARWNLYDPQVIRWRLASPARAAQLQSLTELRTAVEPEAARLAALRAPLADASELMGLAGKLWAAGQSQRRRGLSPPGHPVPSTGSLQLRQRDVRQAQHPR